MDGSGKIDGYAQPDEAGLRAEVKARKRRGHWAKIREAVDALRCDHQLPPNLRPVHRNQRIQAWLVSHNYGRDIPGRSVIARFFADQE